MLDPGRQARKVGDNDNCQVMSVHQYVPGPGLYACLSGSSAPASNTTRLDLLSKSAIGACYFVPRHLYTVSSPDCPDCPDRPDCNSGFRMPNRSSAQHIQVRYTWASVTIELGRRLQSYLEPCSAAPLRLRSSTLLTGDRVHSRNDTVWALGTEIAMLSLYHSFLLM